MGEAGVLIALWLAFAATHMGLSSVRLRPRLHQRLGERGFIGLYSLVAFAVFVPLVWYYFAHKHAGPLLWAVPIGTAGRWAIYVGMGVAVVLMACALVQRSPHALGGDRSGGVNALQRITRHGLFMGIGLFALLHLIPNGYASDVAFFGGMAAFSVVGSVHQDRRKLVLEAETYGPFVEQTPFLPFTGSETLQGLRRLPLPGLVLGILLTAVLRYFHSSWF